MHIWLKKNTGNCGIAELSAHLSGVIPIITVKIFPVRGLFHDKV
jgi:hypothetical protein